MKKFRHFPGKLPLRAKSGQKWFCWDFKVLPTDYVTVNQISVLFHKTTHQTLPFWIKNFWKISQFSRKTYIVCKIWIKMVMLGFEVLPPDYVTISKKISVLFHDSAHPTLPLRPKRISGKFPIFQEKRTLCAKFGQKWLCWDLRCYPLIM